MKAYTFELYQILGIFIPLIVTNCTILGRADAFASRHSIVPAAIDGFMMGLGFLIVLIVIGAIRELLGEGTLLANMNLLFGEAARGWQLNVMGEHYTNFLVAILPPGAFLVAGMLIALKNIIDEKVQNRLMARKRAPVKGSKRVRTTGIVH